MAETFCVPFTFFKHSKLSIKKRKTTKTRVQRGVERGVDKIVDKCVDKNNPAKVVDKEVVL